MENDNILAAKYIDYLGGKENIIEVETCITRIRIVLKEIANIEETALLSLGALKIIKRNKREIHIVLGVLAERIVEAMEEQLKE